jgi:outer membrane protein TolC
MGTKTVLFVAFCAIGLCGCIRFSKDAGFDAVADSARTHLAKDIRWPRSLDEQRKVDSQIESLLANPIFVDDAVQIALLNNLGLQADFQELAISEADLVQSGRLANPRFDFRHAVAAGQYDIEETLSFNVLSLLTMSYVENIEKRRFAATQSAVLISVAQLARETRDAFYTAVAARQSLQYLQQVDAAAQASATLAQRMVLAGNWNRIDQAREQNFSTEAAQSLIRARLAEESARENLMSLMALRPEQSRQLRLAEVLPDLPVSVAALPEVERALQDRLDLQLLRQRIDQLAYRLKLTHSTRFINVLDVGATRVQQGARQQPYENGYTLSLEVPIFDSGAARVKKSEAIYAQAVERLTQAALEARAQIRVAYANYRASFELAQQQRDAVMPLRIAVAQQNLLRYNASLISIFELLSDAREQVLSVDGYINHLRNFWVAKSQLDGALLGSPHSP